MRTSPRVVVRGIATDVDQVLLVRVGRGPAGGAWTLPGGPVEAGESLAESLVRHLDSIGAEALCGPFVDWAELIDEDDHVIEMYFHVVLLAALGNDNAAPAVETTEAAMVSVWDVPELTLSDGVLEILADQGIVDTVI